MAKVFGTKKLNPNKVLVLSKLKICFIPQVIGAIYYQNTWLIEDPWRQTERENCQGEREIEIRGRNKHKYRPSSLSTRNPEHHNTHNHIRSTILVIILFL
jgi:hypothetical protein